MKKMYTVKAFMNGKWYSKGRTVNYELARKELGHWADMGLMAKIDTEEVDW